MLDALASRRLVRAVGVDFGGDSAAVLARLQDGGRPWFRPCRSEDRPEEGLPHDEALDVVSLLDRAQLVHDRACEVVADDVRQAAQVRRPDGELVDVGRDLTGGDAEG